eukprot:COSAG01_NODE_47222_length_392_cov_1.576792_1_plen_78_part_00
METRWGGWSDCAHIFGQRLRVVAAIPFLCTQGAGSSNYSEAIKRTVTQVSSDQPLLQCGNADWRRGGGGEDMERGRW